MATAVSTEAQDHHLGAKNLSVIHAIGQSLSIGPIFSAGLLTSLIAGVAGFSTPLATLLGSLGALGLGYVIAIYARRYAGAGAIYEYLARGANPTFGVFAAGLYFIGALFLGGGGIYIAVGFLAQNFFAVHLGHTIPAWIGGVVVLAIVFALNHFGVRLAIRGVLVLAGFSVLPLLFLSIVMISKGGASGNTLAVFSTAHSSWNSVFNGILFAVTLFIGFEAAASIAEECRAPRRSIPVAVLSAIAICGVFYVLVAYAAAIGYGVTAITKGAWANSFSPLSDLADKYVGNWLGAIIDLVIILDMVSVSIAIMVTCARGFFALGRDGLLPAWTARTSPYDTPLAGNLIVAVWSVLLIVWANLASYGKASPLPSVLQSFFITTAVGSYLIELIYLFLAVVAFYILWTDGRRSLRDAWTYIVVLAGLATPVLAFKGSLSPFPTYPNNLGVYAAAVCVVIAAVWTAGVRMMRPERVQQAGIYALEDAEAAPYGVGDGVIVHQAQEQTRPAPHF